MTAEEFAQVAARADAEAIAFAIDLIGSVRVGDYAMRTRVAGCLMRLVEIVRKINAHAQNANPTQDAVSSQDQNQAKADGHTGNERQSP